MWSVTLRLRCGAAFKRAEASLVSPCQTVNGASQRTASTQRTVNVTLRLLPSLTRLATRTKSRVVKTRGGGGPIQSPGGNLGVGVATDPATVVVGVGVAVAVLV